MRPRGDVRAAMMGAARSLAGEGVAGMTYRDLAARGCVGFDAASVTIKNMAKAGELVGVGTRQVPGIRRPLRTYRLGDGQRVQSGHHLAEAMRGWVTAF